MTVRITATHDDGTVVDITEGVQVAYDIAYGSMDWGSGFLDTEEMDAIARLAEACRFPSFEAALASIQRVREQQEKEQQRRDAMAAVQAAWKKERDLVAAQWQDLRK